MVNKRKLSILAIIPARGGSKRIPNKNVKDFCGQPILSYPIRSAIESHVFTKVVVSTDDDHITTIGQKHGAEVFKRSRATATDLAEAGEAIYETYINLDPKKYIYDYVACLYATAPFITTRHLRQAHRLLSKHHYVAGVLAVTRYSYPIQRALQVKNSQLTMFWPEHYHSRSQDLSPAFHDSGQFYFVNSQLLTKKPNLFSLGLLPLEIPESECQDIDHPEDWKIAEIKYRLLKENKVI